RGWLKRERHPGDARARRLLLTAAGSAIAQRTAAVQAQVVRAMSEAVSADEMALIEQAMQRVSVRLTALLSEA
ncbi:MAG: hypothetical protein HY021_06910, partial [Burkholderiales bacterium]|nr:hypothetical protein [Burkholderiales bacterium]